MANNDSSFKRPLDHTNLSLVRLYAHLGHQKKILESIKALLPHQLANHVMHCVIDEKRLLLYTDSGAWASQLRFFNRIILKAVEPFTRQGLRILQIRISQSIMARANNFQRKAKIPRNDQILAIRNSISGTADDPLNKSLLKLTATLERLSEQDKQ